MGNQLFLKRTHTSLCKCQVHFHASQHQKSADALSSAQIFRQAYGTHHKMLSSHETKKPIEVKKSTLQKSSVFAGMCSPAYDKL